MPSSAAPGAFAGDFELLSAEDHLLVVRWVHGEHHIDATLDFVAGTYTLDSSEVIVVRRVREGRLESCNDLVGLAEAAVLAIRCARSLQLHDEDRFRRAPPPAFAAQRVRAAEGQGEGEELVEDEAGAAAADGIRSVGSRRRPHLVRIGPALVSGTLFSVARADRMTDLSAFTTLR